MKKFTLFALFAVLMWSAVDGFCQYPVWGGRRAVGQYYPRSTVSQAPAAAQNQTPATTVNQAPAATVNQAPTAQAQTAAPSQAHASTVNQAPAAQNQVAVPTAGGYPITVPIHGYDSQGRPIVGMGFDGIPFNGSHLEALRINMYYRGGPFRR